MKKITEKHEIEQFLKKNLPLNIYSIGDLDDFFWPHTTFFGQYADGNLQAVIMLYQGNSMPTLLAMSENTTAISELLRSLIPSLPDNFYTHLSPGLEKLIFSTFSGEFQGNHLKMFLSELRVPADDRIKEVVQLGPSDLSTIEVLYKKSYPGNWFDARMLETNRYYGFYSGKELVSIAGVHVYSKNYKVAALGNITTHPDFRGRGLGTLVTGRLCQVLTDEGLKVGLNVKANNVAAINCYKQIGFNVIAPYNEYSFSRT